MKTPSIFRLRLAGYGTSLAYGLTCGAISVSDEEKALHDAACSLQAVPILWYRKVRIRGKQRQKITSLHLSSQNSPTSIISNDNDDISGSLFNLQPVSSSTGDGLKEFSKFIFGHNPITNDITEDKEKDDSSKYYAGIEAVMSVCDTEDGPVLEIKADGRQYCMFQQKYEILDLDPILDKISSFVMDDGMDGMDGMEAFTFMVRHIPLTMIDHASPGKKWDFKNMMNMSRGNCDCAVKVYGTPSEESLVGSGKKLLLFDVFDSSSFNNDMISREKLINGINALVTWDKEHIIEHSEEKGNMLTNLMMDSICC